MTRWLLPTPVLAVLAAVVLVGTAAASAAPSRRSPLTGPERHAMSALRNLAIQRFVALQSLAASVPEDERPALWALSSPLMSAMRETALAGAVLHQARIAPAPRRTAVQPVQDLPTVPITAMCIALADPSCAALGHRALAYLAAVRVTAANASQLLLYVASTTGRVAIRAQRANVAALLGAIRTSLVAERATGLQLVAQLGAGWDLRPSASAIDAMIAAVRRDPWSVVSRQRAAMLGLDAAGVRRLIAGGIPAARALQRGDLVTLLGADYRAVEDGLGRPPRAHAAQGLTEAPNPTPRPGIAAGRTGETGATDDAPTPCVQTADCTGYHFTTAEACALARGKSGTSATMTGALFQGCDLSEVDAALWTLGGATLRATNLTGATIRWAPNAAFDAATLDRADLAAANLRQATFVGASLAHAVLDGASADAADFDRADLSGASAVGTGLKTARHLDTATLRDADLTNADLSRTALTLGALDRDVPALKGLVACGATVTTQDDESTFYPYGAMRCAFDGIDAIAGN